jgi:NAD(P)-dependent dehydrogenase (short-subunit alcohol dehydrogenase family)
MASLKDKVVVLTGASRGIGAATARMLAEDGPTLVLCARPADANGETKAAVEAIGATAESHGFDVADAAAAKAFVDDVLARHGRIDVLINNAGSGKMGSVADVPPEDYLAVQRVNVMGPYNMIYAALPSMLERDAGTIINLTSARAFIPDRFYAAYCSSKAALLSMTQCLHFDVQDTGVKIFAFSPGFTQTDMVREIYASKVFRQAALTPGEGQPPERPAKVLTWLAREAPDDLAGQHVQVQFNDISRRAGLED